MRQWDFAILAADQWEEMTMEPMKMEAQIWITVKTVSKTEKDGSPNMDYCKDCFQNGEFTEPDITINEMIIRHAKRMLKRNPDLREEEATGILCNFLPNLKRWNPNPDDEIDEDEEPVMGYRGNARDMF